MVRWRLFRYLVIRFGFAPGIHFTCLFACLPMTRLRLQRTFRVRLRSFRELKCISNGTRTSGCISANPAKMSSSIRCWTQSTMLIIVLLGRDDWVLGFLFPYICMLRSGTFMLVVFAHFHGMKVSSSKGDSSHFITDRAPPSISPRRDAATAPENWTWCCDNYHNPGLHMDNDEDARCRTVHWYLDMVSFRLAFFLRS